MTTKNGRESSSEKRGEEFVVMSLRIQGGAGGEKSSGRRIGIISLMVCRKKMKKCLGLYGTKGKKGGKKGSLSEKKEKSFFSVQSGSDYRFFSVWPKGKRARRNR